MVAVELLVAADCMPAFEAMFVELSYFHCCIGSLFHFVHFAVGSGGRQPKELDILHLNSSAARCHSLGSMPGRSLWPLEFGSTAVYSMAHIATVMYEVVGVDKWE
jgi:hypothetical protein